MDAACDRRTQSETSCVNPPFRTGTRTSEASTGPGTSLTGLHSQRKGIATTRAVAHLAEAVAQSRLGKGAARSQE